jgi:hypothetical protein
MTNTRRNEMSIEVAPDNQHEEQRTVLTVLPKSAVPKYCVIRHGSDTPEPFWADNDEDALKTIREQVRSNETPIVHIYKFLCAEVYTPSSMTITLEDLETTEVPDAEGTWQ